MSVDQLTDETDLNQATINMAHDAEGRRSKATKRDTPETERGTSVSVRSMARVSAARAQVFCGPVYPLQYYYPLSVAA